MFAEQQLTNDEAGSQQGDPHNSAPARGPPVISAIEPAANLTWQLCTDLEQGTRHARCRPSSSCWPSSCVSS